MRLNVLVVLVFHFVVHVLPDETCSKSVLPSSRTNGIGFAEYGEYECYGLTYDVAKHLPYSLTFKRSLKIKHELKI